MIDRLKFFCRGLDVVTLITTDEIFMERHPDDSAMIVIRRLGPPGLLLNIVPTMHQHVLVDENFGTARFQAPSVLDAVGGVKHLLTKLVHMEGQTPDRQAECAMRILELEAGRIVGAAPPQ